MQDTRIQDARYKMQDSSSLYPESYLYPGTEGESETMQGLQVWNDQVLLRVSRDARLAFRLVPDDKWYGDLELKEGVIEVVGAAPASGLLYYAIPCVFESLVVRMEGRAVPLLNRVAGTWPTAVNEDELETYPYLHFLEERRTGMPWRLERWYTLAGPYLIFDSQQYFERACPRQGGKDWERLIVQLRQMVDLPAWVQNTAVVAVNLVSNGGS